VPLPQQSLALAVTSAIVADADIPPLPRSPTPTTQVRLMKAKTLLLPTLAAATFLVLSIWTATAAGSTEKVLYNFSAYPHGARPYGNLIADASGNLYGTTYIGGAHELGAVFKLAPNGKGGWTQTVLYSFKGGSDGQYPISRLVFDAAGNLYGTTLSGGASTCNGNKGGCGTVFKLAPNSRSGWTESVIYRFKGGSDGIAPYAGLTLDSAGNLYGTTEEGGTGQSTNCLGTCGTVFRLAPGAHGNWTESILYRFTGSDGYLPEAELILDSAGSLYGTTRYGGSPGGGTVFKLTPSSNSWTQSVLYNFTGKNDGDHPIAGLIFDQAGNLYGTAAEGGSKGCAGGCGVVFELISNGNGSYSESVLHIFVGGASDGDAPTAGLVFDQAGNLYGTTDDGGKSNGPVGVVFELSPSSGGQWTESIVHVFAGSIDGAHPSSGGALVIDKANNLYGTTNTGGTVDVGTAFELTPTTGGQWTKSTIYSFPSTDGLNPNGNLVEDASGNFYGTTFYGGTYGHGEVFKMAPNSTGGWAKSTIYSFKGTTDGLDPSSLVFDKSGNLYGTAGSVSGASTTFGLIFELKPNGSGTWTDTTLYTFSSDADGYVPVSLVFGPSGNLYGETQYGGSNGIYAGTVYQLTNNGTGVWTKTIIHNFGGKNDGGIPEGGLIMDAAGNLYGTTEEGGTTGWGVVFELSPSSGGSWTENLLYSFLGGSDGATPFGGVIFDPAGNLYGTTEGGGSAQLGTVFKLTPSAGSWTESVLHSFTGGSDGAGTLGAMPGLSIDVAGNLYGTTPVGGDLTCKCGIVFELSPGSGGQWTETVLHNFTSFPGDGTGGLPLIVDASGVLYGTSSVGGSANDGAIFVVTP
jgi:uncharacterized repeat protein (TIGR03803 family)